MPRLIVFDVDGTFLDSLTQFERMIRDYSARNGLQPPCFESMKRGYHDPLNHDFKWGLTREEQLHHLHAAWDETDARAEEIAALFEDACETLRRLKSRGHTLAMVTAKSDTPLARTLAHHGLDSLFSARRTLEDRERRGERLKPAPDMLQSVMRELAFNPRNTAMVGDTTMDIEMGIAAGAHTIGVCWGAHDRAMLEKAGAHHIVDSGFAAVAEKVESIFG
jgi:phosphoglycolate phosphatase